MRADGTVRAATMPRPYSRTREREARRIELRLYGDTCVRCGRGVVRVGRCPRCGRSPARRYAARCRR